MSPSAFVLEWIARLARAASPPLRALDVAMGRGRHAVPLARAGYRTFGVDIRLDAVHDAVGAAAAEHLRLIGWCADLTQHPLPVARFDLIIVSRYLQRDLFPALRGALASGGMLLYETFTTRQRELGVGPRSPDHLLEPGELRTLCAGMDVLHYEEVDAPEALARIVARREIHDNSEEGEA